MVGVSTHKEETLRFLQHAGVVHMEPVVSMSGNAEKENSDALARVRRITQIEQAVSHYKDYKKKIAVDCSDEHLVSYAEESIALLQDLLNQKQSLMRLADELASWGNFDPKKVKLLEDNGAVLQRWAVERKKADDINIPDNIFKETIAEGRVILFYTVSLDGPIDIRGASLLALPEMSLSEIHQEMARMQREEETILARLAGCSDAAAVLQKQMKAALNDASFLFQRGTLYDEEYLFGIQGWIPAGQTDDFLKQVDGKHLSLLVEVRDPLPEEEPPVLLKNNWFVNRIEPLLKLYGIPQYRSVDPSYFFAPFMVLFFGICLSDAAYGVIVYIAAHILGKKLGEKIEGLPLVIKLCKAFAVSTIIIGLLTGSIFGYNFENRSWIIFDVSVGVGNPMLYFYLALGLGVVHLSISYILGMLQVFSHQERLQKLGLLCVLWGGVLVVIKMIWFEAPTDALSKPLFYIGVGFLGLGVLLTLLFSSGSSKIFVRLGLGLWNVYGLTGLIGDLLSYARLFGLGIGTAAIASVMNQLALMLYNAVGSLAGIPFAVIVIVIGHAFNLALALLGSTVHSARLHFVEAFKSFFGGGGVEYKPFKIERGSL